MLADRTDFVLGSVPGRHGRRSSGTHSRGARRSRFASDAGTAINAWRWADIRRIPTPSRVAIIDGKVVRYVLVCTDQASFEATPYRNTLQYLRHVLPPLIAPVTRSEREFIRTRIIDGFEAWRDEDPMGVGAYAHFNIAGGFRSGGLVKQYVEHRDAVCVDSGLSPGPVRSMPRMVDEGTFWRAINSRSSWPTARTTAIRPT